MDNEFGKWLFIVYLVVIISFLAGMMLQTFSSWVSIRALEVLMFLS